MGGSEGSSPLGRSVRRWEDNMNVCFQEIGWSALRCINIGKDKWWDVKGRC